MPVTSEQIDPCKVALTVTVEADKVESARKRAYQQFASQIQVPGFRKGKVPPHLVRNYVDPDRVRQRTLEIVVGPAYADALKEADVEPFGGLEPEFELVDMPEAGDLVFKAMVPLRPVVTLGPFKGLEVERRILEVSDEDIDRQIEEVRLRNAEFPQVKDRAVQMGDVILGDIAVVVHGDEEDSSESRSAVIEVGKNIPDFDNGLVGMEVDETKNIEAIYPEDFDDERLRGKRVSFTITVNEIREKVMPELDDAFVQKVHSTAKTPEEFRDAIRESLVKAAQELADNQLEFDIVNKIVANSQINFPDALVRVEMQADYNRLSEYLKENKQSYEEYLEGQGLTREQFEQRVASGAASRIRNSLVLSEIARSEEITVEDADVEKLIERRAEEAKVSVAAVRAFAEKNDQMPQYRDQALTEKILGFLKDASTITDRTVTAEELQQEEEEGVQEAGAEAVPASESAESVEPATPLAVTSGVTGRRRGKASAESEASSESGDPSGAEATGEPVETPDSDSAASGTESTEGEK
ncbi:MAG: trigger factor [Armatimonadaceae bacterium]